MAVKRASKRQSNDEVFLEESVVVERDSSTSLRMTNLRKWFWVAVVVAAVVFFWYRTNTWPVVAVVNYKPIFRYQVDQALFSQGGLAMVDSLVTQKLAEAELDKLGIKIPDS